MKRTKIFLVLFAVSILFVFPASAHVPLDETNCKNKLGGTWEDGTCTVSNSKAIDFDLVIPDGTTLYINDCDIDFKKRVKNYGTINNIGGQIRNFNILGNNGYIRTEADLDTIVTFKNYYEIRNRPGGKIDNIWGKFRNYHTITNDDGGRINNNGGLFYNDDLVNLRGTINNKEGGTIFNNHGFYNRYIINNYGTIINNEGIIFNKYRIFDYNTGSNYGTVIGNGITYVDPIIN